MVEKRLKYLLKAQTLLWLGSAALPCALFLLWRGTSLWAWCFFAIMCGCGWAIAYRYAIKKFVWTYVSIWALAILSLVYVTTPLVAVALSIFWGVILFLFFGIVLMRFSRPHPQIHIIYFLITFSAAGIYALTYSQKHIFGISLLAFVFLYTTSQEYIQTQIGTHNKRIRIYMSAISICVAEALWIASLLSIGYLNVASLILVLYIVSMTIVIRHFKGTLTTRILVKDLMFFAGFSGVIFLLAYYMQ